MPYLNRDQITNLLRNKNIYSNKKIKKNQIQPASLDLTLSNKCYRIKASFIPNNLKISEVIKELSLSSLDLNRNTLLEKNCIYLCELNEKLNLPSDIKGKSNPKSTTGRLDIFTRVITENGSEYDFINYNYKGKLYLVSQSGFTAAFDLETFKKLWNIPIGGFETPTISGKTIFIMGNLGLLAAIDTNTGKLRWQKQYPSYLNEGSFFSEKEISVYKGPSLVDSKVLITNQKGIISIVNANNGTEIDTLKIDELSVPPIPVDGNILFLTANGKLLAYK